MSNATTYTLDGSQLSSLIETVRQHYGSIRKLDLRFENQEGVGGRLVVRVNDGVYQGPFTVATANGDPVERLRELYQLHAGGGQVDLDEVMALIEPAHQQLTNG